MLFKLIKPTHRPPIPRLVRQEVQRESLDDHLLSLEGEEEDVDESTSAIII
jgi:hypothetical protein